MARDWEMDDLLDFIVSADQLKDDSSVAINLLTRVAGIGPAKQMICMIQALLL